MENEIIKRFREEYKKAYKGILDDEQLKEGNSWFEQFILSELKALKEECVDSEIDSTLFYFNDGTVLDFEQLKGYNYKTSLIKKAFAKRGV